MHISYCEHPLICKIQNSPTKLCTNSVTHKQKHVNHSLRFSKKLESVQSGTSSNPSLLASSTVARERQATRTTVDHISCSSHSHMCSVHIHLTHTVHIYYSYKWTALKQTARNLKAEICQSCKPLLGFFLNQLGCKCFTLKLNSSSFLPTELYVLLLASTV